MKDLQALCSSHSPYPIAPAIAQVQSPLQPCLDQWHILLAHQPDQHLAEYILNGIQHGFRIGFNWGTPLCSARWNIQSAYDHPEVVDEYIASELSKGHLVGPLPTAQLSNSQSIHVSRIGIIPKGHNTGKWRLITDLSYPEGQSINDGIGREYCSLEYTTVDKVVAKATALGPGALLAKIDIKSAYRLVRVHSYDRPLLGFRWRGKVYLDAMLPFGLRSAPKVFNALADTLEWCFHYRGVNDVDHYLDDFVTMGPPASSTCARNLRVIHEVSATLGVPLAKDKCEGPSPRLTFLGIEIDTQERVLRLPQEKLLRVQMILTQWKKKRWCRRNWNL